MEIHLFMMQRVFSYWKYTVKPWDFWKKKCLEQQTKPERKSQKVLKVGFCSVFPPFPNGAAAGTYYFLRAFAKSKQNISQGGDVALYLLPLKNKIDKKLFSFLPLHFAKINDPELDVIVFWCLGDQVAMYEKRTAIKTKTIAWQTMHADPALRPREQQTFNSVKQADIVLGVTRWAKKCYQKQIEHVDYLPFGVDSEHFTPNLRKRKEQQNQQFTCLFVSRLHYHKGIIPLLDTIKIVLKKDPTILFHIIGPVDIHSPYQHEIQENLREIKRMYPKNIIVKPSWIPYEDMPSIYATADILLFPSMFEGFGIPLLEAMSSGMSCIVLDKKPMNELVIHGKTGYCLPVSQKNDMYHGLEFPDTKEFAEAILSLKKNKSVREEMGKNARKYVLAEYDFLQIIPKLIQHCKMLCDKEQ